MRTRRRREPVFWLPVTGQSPTTSTKPDLFLNQVTVTVPAQTYDTNLFVREPFDIEPLDTAAGPGLPGDLIYTTAQEIFLKRIVGKIFVAYSADGTPGTPPVTIIAGVGLFVARTSYVGGPIAAGAYDPGFDYSPLATSTVKEPWIWRRTWILQDYGTGNRADQAFPQSNAGYGSVLDGPHVDAKTKRRITNDDTIFMAFDVANLSGATVQGHATFWWQLRGLASTRKPHNRGNF